MNSTLNQIKDFVGINTWNIWFKDIDIQENTEQINLIVKNEFIAQWIEKNYFQSLTKIINKKILVTVNTINNVTNIINELHNLRNEISNNQEILSIEESYINPELTLDNFIVGATNHLAYKLSLKLIETFEKKSFKFPFFIKGDSGVGKTHLMHAIGNQLLKKECKVLYLTSEKFLHGYIRSLKIDSGPESFSEKLYDYDVLFLDDFQFFIGKEKTQQQFFSVMDNILNTKKALIISADQMPVEFTRLDDRMITRLSGGVSVEIHKPDYELKCNLLKAWGIENEIVDLIANLNLSIRELKGAMNRVLMHAECTGNIITKQFIQQTLSELFFIRAKQPEFQDIKNAVLNYFTTITEKQLLSTERSKEIALARHILMYLASEYCNIGYEKIAILLNRERTTIYNGIEKIQKLLKTNNEIKYIIEQIRMDFY